MIKKPKRTPELVAQIIAATGTCATVARALGIKSTAVRYVRAKHGVRPGAGRPTLQLSDFPPTTNWKQSTNMLAIHLGISWTTADRLRTEALRRANYVPEVHLQNPLPGFEVKGLVPPQYAAVDWTENASFLSAHLGLDRVEVLRLKSLARQQRRLK